MQNQWNNAEQGGRWKTSECGEGVQKKMKKKDSDKTEETGDW
jgi:hypothetical protein